MGKMKNNNLQKALDAAYLEFDIAFDLYFIVTEIPDCEHTRKVLAEKTMSDIRKYGYEVTLTKALGKYK